MNTQYILLALLAIVLVQCAANAEEVDAISIAKICRMLFSKSVPGSSSY